MNWSNFSQREERKAWPSLPPSFPPAVKLRGPSCLSVSLSLRILRFLPSAATASLPPSALQLALARSYVERAAHSPLSGLRASKHLGNRRQIQIYTSNINQRKTLREAFHGLCDAGIGTLQVAREVAAFPGGKSETACESITLGASPDTREQVDRRIFWCR